MNEIESIGCEVIGNELKKKDSREEKRTIERKKMIGIYGLRNNLDGKWYIGQSHDILSSIEKRYKKVRCKNQTKLYHALKKYGFENFTVVIIELCNSTIPQDMLDIKEIGWIKYYNSRVNGYNIAIGGRVGIGFGGNSHTEESRKKISESNRRRKLSSESIEKMKASLRGRKWTDERRVLVEKGRLNMSAESIRLWKERVSNSSKGRKMPPKTDLQRKNMSDAQKGKWVGQNNPAYGKCWITNEEYDRFVDRNSPIPDGWRLGKMYKVKGPYKKKI